MFNDVYKSLCKEIGKTPTGVALELGLSKAAPYRWSTGSVPDGNTLALLADYFNVSTDYLLGRSEFRNAEISKDKVEEMKKEIENLILEGKLSESKISAKDEEIKNLKQKINDLFELMLKLNKDYKDVSLPQE